jgi:dTDP-4-amino-4,6-dideoxygalactose transaminase
MLRKHGGRDKYNVDHIGYNARLDTLQAAILLARLKHIDDFNSRRRKLAEKYTEQLRDVPGIACPKENEKNSNHVYHQYTLRVKDGKRDALKDFLKSKDIDTMIYYPVALNNMKLFNQFGASNRLAETQKATEEVLSLPIDPLFNDQVIEHICAAIKMFNSPS